MARRRLQPETQYRSGVLNSDTDRTGAWVA
jgi:hypothetical protein